MHSNVKEIFRHIQELEDEVEQELRRRRAGLYVDIGHRAVGLKGTDAQQQMRFKTGLLSYVLSAEMRDVVTIPVIVALLFPMVLLDATICVYQAICFPLYGMARVRRGNYGTLDRAQLPYLNLMEKLNCSYCAYANGLVSFMREVAARTEQYWCPIKHAQGIAQPHGRYRGFVDFGDGEAYRRELQALREALALLDADDV